MENPLKLNNIHTQNNGSRKSVADLRRSDFSVTYNAENQPRQIKSPRTKIRKLPKLPKDQPVEPYNSGSIYQDNDIEEALQQQGFRLSLSSNSSACESYTDSESGLSDEYIVPKVTQPNYGLHKPIIAYEPSFKYSQRTEHYKNQVPEPILLIDESENSCFCLPVTSNNFCAENRNDAKKKSLVIPKNSPMSSTTQKLNNYQAKGVRIDQLYEYTETESSADNASCVIKQYSPSTRSRVSSLTNVSRTTLNSHSPSKKSLDRSTLTLGLRNSTRDRIPTSNRPSINSETDLVFIANTKASASSAQFLANDTNCNRNNSQTHPPSPGKSSILKITVTGASEESGIGRSSTSSSWQSINNKPSVKHSLRNSENISQIGTSRKSTRSDRGKVNDTDTNHNYVAGNSLTIEADRDSIGSATSIMHRAMSRASRSTATSSSPGFLQIDNDEAILVGDEKLLHDSARRGDIDTVESLIKAGIDVNCRNKTDRTVLHWAAGNGYVAMLQMLLENGGNLESADKFGMTPMLWAAWFGHKPCVELLLRAGAKPNVKNKNGSTLLHCATHNNHPMAVELLEEQLQDFDRELADDKSRRACLLKLLTNVGGGYSSSEMKVQTEKLP